MTGYAGVAPLVSVIIPTYNRARQVCNAIDSVLAQAYRPIEIIVVDDGSIDDTSSAVAGYGDAVRYLRQENGGPSHARNTGIASARGEVIAFLDSDDLWYPEKLARQVEVLRGDPRIGAVDCSFFLLDRGGSTVFPVIRGPECEGNALEVMLLRGRCTSSTILIRTSCLREVGPFNEHLRGAEDWDLWLRLARRYRMAWISTPLTILRDFGDGGHKNVSQMVYGREYVLRQHLTPDVSRPVRRHALARSHVETAIEHLENGARLPAALYGLMGVARSPRNLAAMGALLQAVLGRGLFDRVARLGKSVTGHRPSSPLLWGPAAEALRLQHQGVVYADPPAANCERTAGS